MKTKHIIIYLLFFGCFFNSYSQQQVSISEAQTAGINAMKYRGCNLSEASIDSVLIYSSTLADTLLYEVVFEQGQTILLSGSKACLPILGYNTSNKKETLLDNWSDLPCGLKEMIEEYIEQIKLCFDNDTITLAYQSTWDSLQIYDPYKEIVREVVSPLLTSKWGQSYSNSGGDCNAYNYYVNNSNGNCSNCDNQNCPTGCVATAMAQIMNYWKYPIYNPYRTEQYDWCNMPDILNANYNNTNYTKERHAIATLMRYCGISVDMEYCSDNKCQSSASSSDVRDALVYLFDYDFDADFQRKNWYNNNTWRGRIKHNLNEGWPVYYRGEGHAFVCDGWKNDNMFHFNWGWNGEYQDTWFSLDNLTPCDECNNYTSKQRAVFYIYPSANISYCNFGIPLYLHYFYYYTELSTPAPYLNVPKTFDTLVSVDASLTDYPASWRTIPSGATSEYVAHNQIVLKNGFHAESGSNFKAYIDHCESCDDKRYSPNNPEFEILKDIEKTYNRSVSNDITLNLYPNPNKGSFFVALSDSETEILKITVIDIMGKTVFSKEHFTEKEIALPNAKPGMYYVIVTLNKQTLTKKIIIN